MDFRPTRPTRTLALAAALAGALALSACGKKGPLDLPPSVAPNPSMQAVPSSDEPTKEPTLLGGGNPRTKPAASKGEKRPLPLDVLID